MNHNTKTSLIQYSSFIILWMGIIWSYLVSDVFSFKLIIASSLLLIVSIFTYFDTKLGIKVMLGVIFIGILNLVDFFPLKFHLSFEINSFEIGFEFIIFFIGVIHYFTNKEIISEFIKTFFNENYSDETTVNIERARVERFKTKFINNTKTELEKIVNNDKLVSEARTAAKELLEINTSIS